MSAKTGEGVQEAFQELVVELVDQFRINNKRINYITMNSQRLSRTSVQGPNKLKDELENKSGISCCLQST